VEEFGKSKSYDSRQTKLKKWSSNKDEAKIGAEIYAHCSKTWRIERDCKVITEMSLAAK
jgi:hypothetical protein